MAISTRSILIGLIAVLLIGFGVTLYAQAVPTVYQACVSSAGNMYLVGNGYKKTTCAKGETLISWNSQGPQGNQGIQGLKGDTGLQGPPGSALHLYDANGQNLGLLIGADDGQVSPIAFTAYLQNENLLIHLHEVNNGNVGFELPHSSVSFFERNCQGSAYEPSYLGRGAPPFALFIGARSFKWAVGTPVLQSQSVSDLFDGIECINNDNGTSTNNFYPLTEFTPPFTLPLAGPLEIR